VGLSKASVKGAVLGVIFGMAMLVVAHYHRRTEPQITAHRAILPEADGAFEHVLLHWTVSADQDLARPYSDFLRAIDAAVRVTFVIPNDLSQEERMRFERRLIAIDPTGNLLRRSSRVEVTGPITAWSKDRALVSVKDSTSQRARLVIPAEPSETWKERHNDWRTVEQVVAHSNKEFELATSPFDFDAGDIAVGRGALIIDTNLLEKNRRRGYESIAQLAARLGEYLHMQVMTLGENIGDTPRHHLSMYMTPLTRNHVLVGDPRAAERIVGTKFTPGEQANETGTPLVADFSIEMVNRFDRATQELRKHGFAVTPIVNVPFDDKTYFSYTNGVYEVRGGRHIAYVPTYDLPTLDQAAHEVYRKLGWEVVPIHVRSLYAYHGTIGCVVNVLGRK
jgi:agmatine/peptidylarginine deiminase